MKNIFIVFTPFQCITATSLALKDFESDSDLILIEWGLTDIKLINNLKKIFNNVYIIPNLKNAKRYKKWTIIDDYNYAKNIRSLVKELAGVGYNQIFSSSENHPYIQFIITKILNSQNMYFHFEDGSFDYSSKIEKVEGIVDYLKKKKWDVLLGYNKIEYNYPAQPEWTEKIFLFYPNYRRIELAQKESEQIKSEFFNCALEYIYQDNFTVKEGIVVCLDLSDSEDYIIEINKKICNTLQRKQNVYIKYHPRENPENYYISNNFNIIPAHLPAESVLKSFRGIVISNLSSILHVLTVIAPDVQIICTNMLANNITDESYIRMLSQIGIKMPKTYEGFYDLLKNA